MTSPQKTKTAIEKRNTFILWLNLTILLLPFFHLYFTSVDIYISVLFFFASNLLVVLSMLFMSNSYADSKQGN